MYYISGHYFDYDHVTQVEIVRPLNYTPPVLTFCANWASLMGKTLFNITAREIFALTPNPDSLNEKLEKYWDKYNKSSLAKKITVRKSLQNESIWYIY